MPPPYPSLPFRRPDAAFPQCGFRGGGRTYTPGGGGGTPLAVTQGATPRGCVPPTSLETDYRRLHPSCEDSRGACVLVEPTTRCPCRRGGLESDGGVPPPDAPDACAGGARRRDEVQRGTTRDAWDVYPDSFQTAPDAHRPDPSEVSLHGRWSAPGMYLAAPRCAWSYLGDR